MSSKPFESALDLIIPPTIITPGNAVAAKRVPVVPGWSIMLGVAASMLSLLMAMRYAKLTILLYDPANVVIGVLAIAAIGAWYRFRHAQIGWQRVTRDSAEYIGLFVLMSLLGATASYAVAATTAGWADEPLHKLDAWVGFDWISWYELVSRHPGLQFASRLAYGSIFLTPAVLLVYFAYHGRAGDARRFLATFWIAAILTLALFWFMPAQGPLVFLWHGPIPYMPVSGLYQAEIIPLLRQSAIHQVNLGDLRGLVGSPSFHAASAILYIAAAWNARPLRMPIITLNLAMLISIPVEGTHYLSDVIAGAAVAMVTLITVNRLVSWRNSLTPPPFAPHH